MTDTYDKLTVANLQKLLDERKIPYRKADRKPTLLQLLKGEKMPTPLRGTPKRSPPPSPPKSPPKKSPSSSSKSSSASSSSSKYTSSSKSSSPSSKSPSPKSSPVSPLPPISYLEDLNINNLYDILSYLPLHDIYTLCKQSRALNAKICNSEAFWEDRAKKLNITTKFEKTWKAHFQNMGNVILFGDNRYHQLGRKSKASKERPNIIGKSGANNAYNSYILDIHGQLWGCGESIDGRLGVIDKVVPTFIKMSNIHVKQVAAGTTHVLVIDEHNNLFGGGNNEYNQLVDSTRPGYTFPHDLHTKAKKIACGTVDSVYIDMEDNVHVQGRNTFTVDIKAKEIACGSREAWFIDMKNDVYMIDLLRTLEVIPMNIKAKAVACGYQNTLIIDLNDNVLGMGVNTYGQLGVGDYIDRDVFTPLDIKAKKIACGKDHSMLIDMNDTVMSFGNNSLGQLGVKGIGLKSNIPINTGIKASNIVIGAASSSTNDYCIKLAFFKNEIYISSFVCSLI
jgi:alpha-tubulin suppressor-like RCC1 family protein